MKEIVILSGKGGTGKTSISASFAHLEGSQAAIADCDVDASDLHLLLEPKIQSSEQYFGGYEAVIDPEGCIGCGECMEACQFDAIFPVDDVFEVDPIRCEGCGLCAHICPTKTIAMEDALSGDIFFSETRFGSPMVHAKLGIGAENSGKLVTKVKEHIKEIAKQRNSSTIIVDGSPGIGCPVVSSLSDADYVVLVTEPSVSGIHDLKRVHDLVRRFNIPAGVIINKADINPENTRALNNYLETRFITKLAEIPYSESFPKALTNQKTLIEWGDEEISTILRDAWNKVKDFVNR